MNRIYLMLVTSFFLVSGVVSAQSRKHVVQPQETLYRISIKYNVTVADLYRLNPTTQAGIQPGQEILINDRVVER